MTWPDQKKLALFVNVAFEAWTPGVTPGVSPMGNPLPAGLTDTAAGSWGNFGHRRGIWRLLDVLDRLGTPATVMVSGILTEVAPSAVRAVVAGGHEVCGHAWVQEQLPAQMSRDAEAAMIDRCLGGLGELGADISGWISPRCTPGPHTFDLLRDRGLRWTGDVFDDDRPYLFADEGTPFVGIPLTMETNDLPLVMKHGHTPDSFRATVAHTIEAALGSPHPALHVDITAHTHVSGRVGMAAAFELAIREAASDPRVWIGTRAQVSQLMLEHDKTGAAQ
ncbi:polysaccharide deacetylase family protein [Rhodococcus koreensis]|uniref:polysaccharide deacetylase family protein n=1 Tax=Rhodococcus koreensis TaxID=99653 RepID=UPI0036700D9E